MPQVVSGWTVIATTVDGTNPGPTAPAAGGGTRNLLASRRWYYDGEVPSTGAPVGYFLGGSSPEGESGFIGQPGTAAIYTVHAWAESKLDAERMVEWLWGLFHMVRRPMTGNTVWESKVRRRNGGMDRSRKLYQSIAEISMEALAA